MLFTSLQYLLFLPAIVLLFWVLPIKWRMPMLLLASYFFYMSWMPVFVFLIFGMTVFNWIWGNVLFKAEANKKLVFGLGLAANLLCLGTFKYANFLTSSLDSLVGLATGHAPGWVFTTILPLAISFFTFEFIHYLFDIYRGKKPIDSFVLFALFAAFFPTQIAGPIKRYPDFEAQMKEVKQFKLSYFDEGVPLIIIGFAKKILLADTLAQFVNMGYTVPGSFGALELWLFAYAFAFQIYFDFSAYTDIARGSAKLFGYSIPINFNLPYIANNMSNFWHRWHISLSSWLRDYLFIPMGGSRGGRWKTNLNLLITMTLGGLWHGASWNFVVWGIYHGLALIAHREFAQVKEQIHALDHFVKSKIGNLVSILITFHAVCIGWVFFRVQDIGTALNIVKKMVLFNPILTGAEVQSHQFLLLQSHLPVIVTVALIMLVVLLIINLPLSILNEKTVFKKTPAPLVGIFSVVLILLMVTFLPDGTQPFIYFQF
jgi:alginate O-acetyltransferase complex protein AlgI